MSAAQNPASFVTPEQIAKLARKVAKAVKAAGLSYEQWRQMNKQVRKLARLAPPKKGRKLPHILTDDQFRAFFQAIDRAGNPQHVVMLRLLFHTAARVAELTALEVPDVDLAANRIRINDGKGGKDRVVLFGSKFGATLRAYLGGRTTGPLFVSRQGGPLTARRLQQIVSQYAKAAGVQATPHTFRHQAITWLTRNGMADAELQLITGHSRKDTLAVYQHLALGPAVEGKYQEAMNRAEV